MSSKTLRGNLLLLVAAFIWGSNLVGQSVASGRISTFTFQTSRAVLGCLVLLPVILLRNRTARRRGTFRPKTALQRKWLWRGGFYCGTTLGAASALQQIGIAYTTVGNAGFISSVYVLLVPLFGLFFGKKVRKQMWLAIAIALCGLYCLSVKGDFTVAQGDGLIFASAATYAVQIMLVDHFSPHTDGVELACVEFIFFALMSAVPMLLLERPTFAMLTDAWLPIAYAGVLSNGVAFTFQIIGQKRTTPTAASLIMCTEGVFSLLAAVVVLHQMPTWREGMGCILLLIAIVLAQFSTQKECAG